MKDKLKIITLGIAVICIAPLIITNQDSMEECQKVDNSLQNENKTDYLSSFNFSQKTLRLNHEFVQYKIKFYKNTTVEYKYFLKFRVKDLHPLYYFIMFTDGKKGVMKRKMGGKNYEAPIIGHSIIPSGILLDINFGKLHMSVGKLLFKLLPIGNIDSIKGTADVTAGTEWFLTVGIYHQSDEETFYISLKSEEECFEIINLDRSNRIEYLTSIQNEFSGFYCGIKFLSHGFSYARNLMKTITTKKGSIIRFSSVGHLKGQINVESPDGKSYMKDTRKLASFQYIGNLTGEWKLSSSGFGFPWKHIVSIFYIDVDPHFYLSNWD